MTDMTQQRMTDEQFERRLEDEPDRRAAFALAFQEAFRARHVEKELAEQLRQKDRSIRDLSQALDASMQIADMQKAGLSQKGETIRALADALELVRRRGFYADTQAAIDAALRLAGRNP